MHIKGAAAITADTSTEAQTLTIRRMISASPERLFRAWTNADELKSWWGPVGVRCIAAEIDLCIGGRYAITNELTDGAILVIAGEFEVVEPPRLLVYSWRVGDASPSSERVTVRFEAHGGETECTLTHERIETHELRERHLHGWLGCLDGLAEHLHGEMKER